MLLCQWFVVPVEADGVAHETTRLQNFQRTRTVPRPLTFGVEHHAMFVRPDSTRTADATTDRNRLALRGDLHTPTTQRNLRSIRLGQAKRDPDVAVFVGFGSKPKTTDR